LKGPRTFLPTAQILSSPQFKAIYAKVASIIQLKAAKGGGDPDAESPGMAAFLGECMADKKQERADLLADLFGEGQRDSAPALAKPLEAWLTTSKSFTAFTQTYQRKIAKKIRICRDVEESYNLYCELRTAYLLVQEPTFAVAYELLTKEQGRSADFTVTFRTNTPFHVEVTRLRLSQQEQQLAQQGADTTVAEQEAYLRGVEGRRLTDVVCDKFGQFSPSAPNVLWVWSESHALLEVEVASLMAALKRGIEQRDEALMARYGFDKPADFVRALQRLSALVVLPLGEVSAMRMPLWWLNKDARHPLPGRVLNHVRGLIAADDSLPFVRG
jgi:hypothetical protein